MEESGIVGFTVTGAAEKVTDFRTAPFCSQLVFSQMLGMEEGDHRGRGARLG
ncbi:hypothetical protein D9M68_740970 [compost metagenome]